MCHRLMISQTWASSQSMTLRHWWTSLWALAVALVRWISISLYLERPALSCRRSPEIISSFVSLAVLYSTLDYVQHCTKHIIQIIFSGPGCFLCPFQILPDQLIFFPADITWVLMHFPQLPLVFSYYLPLRHFCQKILNRLLQFHIGVDSEDIQSERGRKDAEFSGGQRPDRL